MGVVTQMRWESLTMGLGFLKTLYLDTVITTLANDNMFRFLNLILGNLFAL